MRNRFVLRVTSKMNRLQHLSDLNEIAAERERLVSKFGKTGKCQDVPGLCKAAKTTLR